MEARDFGAARGTPCEPTNLPKVTNGGGAKGKASNVVEFVGGELVPHHKKERNNEKRAPGCLGFMSGMKYYPVIYGDYIYIYNRP